MRRRIAQNSATGFRKRIFVLREMSLRYFGRLPLFTSTVNNTSPVTAQPTYDHGLYLSRSPKPLLNAPATRPRRFGEIPKKTPPNPNVARNESPFIMVSFYIMDPPGVNLPVSIVMVSNG